MVNKSKKSLPTIDKNTKSIEIFKKSLSLYKERFWTLFIISLLMGLSIFLEYTIETYVSPFFSSYPNPLIPILIITIIFIINFLFLSIGFATLSNTTISKEIDVFKSYKQTWNKILPFSFIFITYLLICIFGTILLIIPGILFVIWFNLCFWIYIDQGIKGTKALSLSYKYMQGNVAYYIKKWIFIIFTVSIPFLIFQYILKLVDTPLIIRVLITSLIKALIQPISIIYSLFIYKYIKSTKAVSRI